MPVLEKWDAIELFCRMISKHEKNRHQGKEPYIEGVRDNNWIREKLSNWIDEDRHGHLIKEIFTDQGFSDRKKSIYLFLTQFKNERSVILSDHALNAFRKYIGEPDFAAKRIRQDKQLELSDTQRTLEGSKWWLYFYDEFDTVVDNKAKSVPGVSIAFLELHPYGKTEFTRLRNSKIEFRKYTGIYQTFRKDHYLSFRMKMEPDSSRDLRMWFHIGSGGFSLAVGLSANVSSTDYTRAVMLESCPLNKPDVLDKLGFYHKEYRWGNPIIPDYVQKFFEHPERKIVRVPRDISSVEDLYKHL